MKQLDAFQSKQTRSTEPEAFFPKPSTPELNNDRQSDLSKPKIPLSNPPNKPNVFLNSTATGTSLNKSINVSNSVGSDTKQFITSQKPSANSNASKLSSDERFKKGFTDPRQTFEENKNLLDQEPVVSLKLNVKQSPLKQQSNVNLSDKFASTGLTSDAKLASSSSRSFDKISVSQGDQDYFEKYERRRDVFEEKIVDGNLDNSIGAFGVNENEDSGGFQQQSTITSKHVKTVEKKITVSVAVRT
jgi:hypothetical protein